MISVAQLLSDIAGGFCPVLGKSLPKSSSAQSAAAIRLLYSLAIELTGDGEAVEVAPRPARKRVSGYTAKQVAELLTALAGGVNPSTGEILPDASLANTPDAVRLLYTLAMEFKQVKSQQPKPKKQSRDLEGLRESNLANGLPARSHFPWSEEDYNQLLDEYHIHRDIETVAQIMERSTRAIAVKLGSAGVLTPEEVEPYR